jgi:hypothetical protein
VFTGSESIGKRSGSTHVRETKITTLPFVIPRGCDFTEESG